MKSCMVFVAVLAVVIAAAGVQNAHAQLEISLGGGANLPRGEYADEANMGYSITGGAAYRVMPMLALGFDLGYNGNKAPDAFTQALGPDVDVSTSIFQYSAALKVMYPIAGHSIYAKGSVGNYRGSAKVSSSLGSASVNTTDLGYGIGGGFAFNGGGNTSFFADITHHSVKYDGATEATNYFAFTVGGIFYIDLFKESLESQHEDDLKVLH